jgi:trehalose 6-phosphate phosphatase
VTDAALVREAVREALDAGGHLLVLADFDGTLVPIAPEPARVRLDHEVGDCLRTLGRSERVRAGIVSGRGLADLRERVGVDGLIYAGCHGLEVEGPEIAWLHPTAANLRPRLAQIADALRTMVGAIPGALVEPKGLAVALHYRNTNREAVGRLEAALGRVLGRDERLTLLRGKEVFEVLPDVGWGKGECALWIRDTLFRDAAAAATMLYVGDDETDELAFRVLDGKAITVRVGSAPGGTAAAYRVPDVIDVRRLLAAVAAEAAR